ncbi:CHAT domain-containing protein [Microcoleus sp. B3-D2]|uniref:CHAT domain-containing protein n=1 Tax=unclassified Microcoleus TaxID=2642155 RepID=UPI002FD5F69C
MTPNKLHLLGWLFIVSWLSAAAGSANAQPIAPAPDGTNTVVTPSGNRYDISGGAFSGDGANLFHSFTQFGLSEAQTANFLTNPNIQNILGRITGGNPSLINGLIQVTGGNSNLFLMNPAGMIFGPNASLNVPGSFNATTATGIGFGNNQWFSAIGNNNWATLIGTPNSFAFTNLPGGSIVNAGNLTVTPGQSLSLIGGTVVNTGQLTAPGGNITVMAVPGQNLVRIAQTGNLLSLEIQPTASQSSLPNNFAQPVLSLPELLTGKGQEQATNLAVNPNGEVVLTGNVSVPVTAGTAIASGSLNVSGNTGGTVNILGDKVGVIAGNIDASGINGGGNVLIGGDYQGLGTVPNASRTFVSSNSTINANAVSNGNGGRVIVWADETTRFNGNITARGGLFSGNGGFVEVSGKQSLDFQGLVDLRSTFGIAGTLLLDPTDITISTDVDTGGTLSGEAFTPSDGTSTINNGTLQTQLDLGNVTISTASGSPNQGDITVKAPVSWLSTNSLTLNANNSILVNNDITANGGSITLNADVDGSGAGAIAITNAIINSNGGNIILGGGTNPSNSPAVGTAPNPIGVSLTGSTLNAGTGNISIRGQGLAGDSFNHGISVSTSKITTAETGSITLNGIGGNGTGSDNKGINIITSTVESIGTGSITLNGTGGNGTFNNRGISIDSSTVRAGGNVSLTGNGAGTLTNNIGVRINNSTVESTPGNGTVTITGTGGNGTSGNEGITIIGFGSTVKSQNGDITLTGTGQGSAENNRGLLVERGVVNSTGTGNLTLTGVGGNGTDGNQGISLGISFSGGTVKALSGNVTLTGTGGGTGTFNDGIFLGESRVNSAGLGKVTLTGTGSGGTGSNSGIRLDIGTIGSQDGDIALTGTGVGTDSSSYGINLGQGYEGLTNRVQSTGTGNINLTGKANNNSIPINIIDGVIDAALGGNVTLTGDEIQLSETSQVNGIGTIQLQPLTPSLDITVGGNTADARLNLSAAELAPPVLNGFSQMIIGRTDGTGTIAVDPAGVTFNFPVTMQAATIAVDGNITGVNNASITFKAPTTNLNANILTNEQNITFGEQVSLGTGSNVTLDTGLTDAGHINFGGTVDGDGNLVLTAGTGIINLSGPIGATVPLRSLKIENSLNVTSPNPIAITTTDNITITAADITNPGRAIGLTSTNGNIDTTAGAIDTTSSTGNAGPITLSANNITVGNLNSSSSSGAAGDIAIATPNQVGIQGIDANGLPGTGNITISGNEIISSGIADSVKSQGTLSVQPFSPNVGIRFQAELPDDPQAIDIGTPFLSSLRNGFSALVFGGKTTTGNITVENLPVSFPDPVTFNTQGTISINPNQSISGTDNASITLNATTNNLNGNITTQSQDITINGNTLVGDSVLVSNGNSAGGNILFNNNIDGSGNLTLETGTGNIDVKGAVGNTPALGIGNVTVKSSAGTTTFNQTVNAASLTTDIGGTTQLNGNVTTIGSQTYGDAVTIANNPILSGSEITFNDTVNGSSDLTANAVTGNVTFNGAVGNPTNTLGNLTANSKGTTAFNQTVNAASLTTDADGTTQVKGNVTTTGSQTYGDAVTIANNPILTGSEITFNNTVDGTSDLTAKAVSGNVTFNSAVGAASTIGNLTANSTGTTAFNQTVNVASLTTDAGGTTQVKGNVTTTGAQTYGDAVTIANNPILSGDSITFNNTVDGTSDLTVNAASGNLTFKSAIGETTPLTNLTANSKISLGGNVTTTGSQTYADAVTIAKSSIISGSGITFTKTVDVAGNLGIAADNVNLKGTVTTTNDGALTITNKVNLNIDNNLNLDGAFIQNGGGTVAVNGNIATTNDNISFSGPVTLKAPVTFTLGDASIAFGSSLSAGSNPLTLTAGEIDFSGNVSGTGALTLQPATAGKNIVVGGTDNNTSAFDLTASEISLIQNGFSSIAIGRSDSSANVSIPSNLTFLDPVNIQTGTGTIALDGTLTGNDNSSIALNASTINLNYGINTNKNPIALNGTVQLGNDINLSTGGGDIKIIGAIGGNHLLNLDAATGNVLVQGNIGGTAPLSALNVTATQAEFTGNIASNSGLNIAAASTKLGGNVTTNQGNININGVLGLTKDVILSTAGGNIAFGGAIDSIDGARNLTLASGSGSITFNAAVGATSKLGNVAIENAGNVTGNSTINAQQLTALNTEKVNLSGDVTASKVDITAKGDISVKNITTNGGEILFTSGNNFTAGNLNTSGNSGGNITVKAITSITTGQINSSAIVGNAGNVFLDPIGDIQVEWINAQGGTGGTGGEVTAITGNFFRATGTFSTPLSPTGFASISTAGGAGGGKITIVHAGGDGGTPIQPFVVGDAASNGTAGAITTGKSSITSQSFPRSSSVGNIVLSTDDAIDPTPTVPPTTETIPPTIPPTTETIPPTIPPTTETIPPTIPPTTETIPPTIPPTTETIAPAIPPTTETIPPTIPPLTETIPPAIPSLTETISPTIPPLTETIPPTIPPLTETIPPTIPPTVPPATPRTTETIPPLIPPTIPPITRTVLPTIPPTIPPTTETVSPITGTVPPIKETTGTVPLTIPQTTGTVLPTMPLTTETNQQVMETNQQVTETNQQENQQVTETNQQENQQLTVINQQENQQLTVINQQENQQVTSPLESVQDPLKLIAPVTTLASPTGADTPAPQPSTPDSEDFQPPKTPPRDNPAVAAADRILTIDQSITSPLPADIVPSPPESKQPPTVNPTSNLVLGYLPSPDRLFEGNDIQKTVWGIEEMRNQEFGEYLGVKANLPEEKTLISTFQETLQNIEQQTGKRSGILYIVSRADRLELILVAPVGRPIHYSVPEANRAALFPTVKDLRDEITNPAKRASTSYLAPAQQLYKWAIAPLEKDLENLGIHTLLVSVDAGLRSLPFAALHDGKGFLMEKYSFSLIPSFSSTNTDYKAVRDATVLAMGRSEFVEQQPLPNVPIELQAIVAQWHGPSFLNSTFTLDNLNSEHAKGGFRIVHLATHAEFKPGKPSNSYIQLWNSKLQLDRMESLNWRNPQVDLLVLSACRTALGDREAELGFGGLAVKSGTKSALGSLWYVDDGGTLGLMSEFYHHLRGTTTKAEALQRAQQAIMSGKVRLENGQLVTTGDKLNLPANLQQTNQNFSHPYYWSSFTMIGSPW